MWASIRARRARGARVPYKAMAFRRREVMDQLTLTAILLERVFIDAAAALFAA
jgi:hypothetical protein